MRRWGRRGTLKSDKYYKNVNKNRPIIRDESKAEDNLHPRPTPAAPSLPPPLLLRWQYEISVLARRNSCAHKIRSSGNLQTSSLQIKYRSRVKRTEERREERARRQRNGGWPDGNITRRYSRQVARARLEFDASRALKSRGIFPFLAVAPVPAAPTRNDPTPQRLDASTPPFRRRWGRQIFVVTRAKV